MLDLVLDIPTFYSANFQTNVSLSYCLFAYICTQIPSSSKTLVQGTLIALSLPHHLEVLVEITPKIRICKILFALRIMISVHQKAVWLYLFCSCPNCSFVTIFKILNFFFLVSRSPVTKSTFLQMYLLILNIVQMVLRWFSDRT